MGTYLLWRAWVPVAVNLTGQYSHPAAAGLRVLFQCGAHTGAPAGFRAALWVERVSRGQWFTCPVPWRRRAAAAAGPVHADLADACLVCWSL